MEDFDTAFAASDGEAEADVFGAGAASAEGGLRGGSLSRDTVREILSCGGDGASFFLSLDMMGSGEMEVLCASRASLRM